MERDAPKRRCRPRKEKRSTGINAKGSILLADTEAEPETIEQGPSTSRGSTKRSAQLTTARDKGSTSIQGTPKGPALSTTPNSGIFSLSTMPSRLILAPEMVQSLRRNPLIWELPAPVPALTVTPAEEEPEGIDKSEQLRIDEVAAVPGDVRRKRDERTRKKSITPSPSELDEIYSADTAMDSSGTESESEAGVKRGRGPATIVPPRKATNKPAVETRDSGSKTEDR